jgi:site-specific DNA-methyltransferase (adenine-specific)
MADVKILHGDCREQLKTLPDNSIDSIVTDPPYGLSVEPDMTEVLRHWLNGDDYEHTGKGFMGKSWDSFVPGPSVWRECLRVLKPGGHMLSFFGSRTYDLGVTAIRLAGFEIRDQIMWVYGTGFPKNHDISKAIDNAAGAERTVGGRVWSGGARSGGIIKDDASETTSERIIYDEPATPEAKKWQGWGTALKPSHEPICVARKPISEKTIADNVLQWGVGALNIDASRVGEGAKKWVTPRGGIWTTDSEAKAELVDNPLGRWPANFIHDGSIETEWEKFFYCAKANNTDRNDGLDDFEGGKTNDGRKKDADNAYQRGASIRKNTHPTVKPTDLMRYLCKMITPTGGTVLDPFTGSGSTGRGAVLEGFNFIGIEMSEEYVEIAKARIAVVEKKVAQVEDKITTYNNLFEEE